MRQQYLEEQAREISNQTGANYEKVLKASKIYWEDKYAIAVRSTDGALYTLDIEGVTRVINKRWLTQSFLKRVLEHVADMDYVTEVINDLIIEAAHYLYREECLDRLERRRIKRQNQRSVVSPSTTSAG